MDLSTRKSGLISDAVVSSCNCPAGNPAVSRGTAAVDQECKDTCGRSFFIFRSPPMDEYPRQITSRNPFSKEGGE